MQEILEKLNINETEPGAGSGSAINCNGGILESISPVDGAIIGKAICATRPDYEKIVSCSKKAFKKWRSYPAPARGDIVRQIGNALRKHKKELGALISYETGKIRAEGEGEVQEMIDIADFAVGQSRMLYGLSMHSERPDHRMFEQWHPLGPVGIITAFNFPTAPFAWNAMLALIAGDTVIWKPSSKAFVSAIATMKILWSVFAKNDLFEGIASLVIGDRNEVGEPFLEDLRIPLISATGSVPMGRHVANKVGARLGKTILELGGNNAVIVTPNADLDMAVRTILFGAVGTAGQRCTTSRRVIVHEEIYEKLKEQLIKAYKQVKIGNPLDRETLMGPLIDTQAVKEMQAALVKLKDEGGEILYGGEPLKGDDFDSGAFVTPCICFAKHDFEIVQKETFAPILYLIKYQTLKQAIKYHNAVPQGLSSSIFTTDIRESEQFLSYMGSDCGIANVNVGTSGAEIGGAFGGEKETGGGRESGSDAWKGYMRRQTSTINWSDEIPLAQGIKFDID